MQDNLQPSPLARFFRQFDRVFCISLPGSIDRRNYITDYFKKIGVSDYEFFDATDKSEEIVSDYYSKGLVATWPPCFRCGKLTCGRDDCNNILIPPQVTTFITYLRLWKYIVNSDIGTALIVEDDVRFTDYAPHAVEAMVKGDVLAQAGFVAENPVLLRFGWALSGEHKATGNIALQSGVVRMSNPCHAITRSLARRLLDNFSRVDHTVDVYQHQQVGSEVANYTVFPPLAFELSCSVGALESLIHPKPVRVGYLQRHNPDNKEQIASAVQSLQRHVSHILFRPLLVIGHPRCGSGYMSKLLQTAGLDVGHERMGKHGISSWMFAVTDDRVPFAADTYSGSRRLSHFQYIVHHVRDPRNAVPSIMRDNMRSEKSFRFRRRHIKQAFGVDLEEYSSETERAVLSYIYWNRIVERNAVDIVVRVEDEEDKLLKYLGEKKIISAGTEWAGKPGKDINSNKPYQGIIYDKPCISNDDWLAVSPDILEMLNRQCVEYGYQEIK